MKKTTALSLFAVMVLIFQSCSSGLQTNAYFGTLPSFAKSYQVKLDEKETEFKKCTDRDEAFKLDKEKQLLREEYENEVKQYASDNEIINKEIPFEALNDQPYTIKTIRIKEVNTYGLNLVFSLNLKKDIRERHLFFYFKAINSKGEDIPNSKSVAMTPRIELTAGLDCEAIGTWKILKEIADMQDFAKVVEITKEEYDKK